jgi:hypothetical protein
MTDEDKERLAREKNHYRKVSTGNLLSLSLSTSSRLQQSQQTNLPAEAKHGEEKKAYGNRNKSYVTISSEQIHQEYNSKSLETFFLLHISHLMLSICLSLAEISKNGKINKAGTQKRNKGAKETEKKRKKVKQNAGCSHSERHRKQQKKARLISLPSSASKQACRSFDAASQAWQEAYRSLDTHLSQARQACRSFDKHLEHGKSTRKQAATSIKAKKKRRRIWN